MRQRGDFLYVQENPGTGVNKAVKTPSLASYSVVVNELSIDLL